MDGSGPLVQQLAVERWGQGRPVLLLHGIGASSRYWHRLRAVSSGYRAVAPDLLGFGSSPRPLDIGYDVHDHLAALLPLMRADTVIVAHSTGAVLAAAIAASRPDLVTAMLLVGAPVYQDVADAQREVSRLGFLARVTASGSRLGRLSGVVLHSLVKPVSPWLPSDLPKEVVEDFWKHSWTSYSRTLRRVVVGHPIVPDLMNMAVPCTLLYGRSDRTASTGPLPELLHRNPLLRHVQVDGGHHLPAQAPRVVADALGQMLGQPPRPKTSSGA